MSGTYVVDICYYSYILSTEILPLSTKVNITKSQYISAHHQDLMNSSEAIMGDVIDSLARIWLDIWKNYEQN